MPLRGKFCCPVQRGRDEPRPGGGGAGSGGVRSPAPISYSGEVSPAARRPVGAGEAYPCARGPVGAGEAYPGAGSSGGRARPRAPRKPSHPYPSPGDTSSKWRRDESTAGGGGVGRASTGVSDSGPVSPSARRPIVGEEGDPGAGSGGGGAPPRAAKKRSNPYPAAVDTSSKWGPDDSTPGGGPDARRPAEAEGAYPGAGSGGSGAEPTAASQPHGDTYKKLRRSVALNKRIASRKEQWEAEDSSSSSSGCVNPNTNRAAQARASTQGQGRSKYKPAGYCWRCRERRGREIAEPLLHICTCSRCGGGCIVCSSTISAVTPVLDMEGESHVLKSLLATSPGWSRQGECSGLSPVRRPLESVLSARRRKPLGTTKRCDDCRAAADWAVSCCGAHLCSVCLELGYRSRHGPCTADGAPGILDSRSVDLDEDNSSFYCSNASRFLVREQRGSVLHPAEVFEVRFYTCFTDLHASGHAPPRRRVVLYHVSPSGQSVLLCHFEFDSSQG